MASSDYISREALKELFDGIYDCADLVFEPDDQICAKQHSSCGSCRWLETKRAIQKRVMSLPAADVVEVVRCKDCKWYQIDELKQDGTEDRRYKPSVCVLAEQRRDPNHFCADGKMREEN